MGSSRTITWVHNLGPSESVKIELSRDDGQTYPIVIQPSTASDGTQSVVVRPEWVTNQARIRISSIKDTAVVGVSLQAFRIQ